MAFEGPLVDNFNMTIMNNSMTNATNVEGNGTDMLPAITGIASLEQHQFAKYVLFFYILPFVAVVGILGNTLSLTVLQVTRRAHAFNVYLMALTSADVLLLLLALSRCVVLIVARYPEVRYPALNIYGEFYLGIFLGSWLQRISATLISIISIERFVAVAFPFKVKSLALDRHPLKIIAWVVFGNFLCQIPTFVLLDVAQMEDPATNSTNYIYVLRFPTQTAAVVRQIYLVFLAVITNVLPLVIVFTSTVSILICLKMRPTQNNLSRTSRNEVKERETMTLTLVSLAIIFTICYIPAISIYAIASTYKSFSRREVYLIAIIVDINIVCMCLNSASDFIIYVLRSKSFRALFVARLFPCMRHVPLRGQSATPTTSVSDRFGTKIEGPSSSDGNVTCVSVTDNVAH